MKILLITSLLLACSIGLSFCTAKERPDPLHCEGAVSDTLGTNDNGRVYMPTAFSGNNDGLNDICRPLTQNIASISFKLYDGNNQLVYSTTQLNQGWLPAPSTGFTKYYFSFQATTLSNHQIAACGETYNITCLPANRSMNQFSFEDQLTPFGFTGVTAENPVVCP